MTTSNNSSDYNLHSQICCRFSNGCCLHWNDGYH